MHASWGVYSIRRHGNSAGALMNGASDKDIDGLILSVASTQWRKVA